MESSPGALGLHFPASVAMISFVSGQLVPDSSFEVLCWSVGMASAIDPACRSATSLSAPSHTYSVRGQIMSGMIPRFPPNQALQLTADRRVTTLEFYERVLDIY
jgi:hypothetical protein